MNKLELVTRVTELNDVETKVAASRIIEHVIETISTELAEGREVTIAGLGKFSVVTREGTTKLTGEEVAYKTNGVKFKPSASLKRAVNVEG